MRPMDIFFKTVTYKDSVAFLMWVVVVAALLWLWLKRNNLRATFQFSSVETLSKVPKSFRVRFSFLGLALRVLAVTLMVFALARPQEASTKVKKNVEGIDLNVAITNRTMPL